MMDDLNRILSVIENPTRRRILQALAKEPHYPLQLSKELGVSQQAVVKNLDIMERSGLVSSSRQSSRIGPSRILYRPSCEFTITIDLCDGMFETRMERLDGAADGEGSGLCDDQAPTEFEAVRRRLSQLETELEEIGKTRMRIVRQRNRLIRGFLDDVGEDVPGYAHRNLLYEMMNNPEMDLDALSEEMGVNTANMNRMVDELREILDTR